MQSKTLNEKKTLIRGTNTCTNTCTDTHKNECKKKVKRLNKPRFNQMTKSEANSNIIKYKKSWIKNKKKNMLIFTVF